VVRNQLVREATMRIRVSLLCVDMGLKASCVSSVELWMECSINDQAVMGVASVLKRIPI